MAWTVNVNFMASGHDTTEVFGQVQFSGSYTTGGDAAGTVVTAAGANTAGWPDFHPGASALHAGRAPVAGGFSGDGGYIGVVIPVAGSPVPSIKIINPATGSELAAGAYPAAITGAANHAIRLTYRTNL